MSYISRNLELLFVYRAATPIWRALFGDKSDSYDFYQNITSSTNFANWKSGRNLISPTTTTGIFKKTIAIIRSKSHLEPVLKDELIARIEQFRQGYEEGGVDFNVRAAARTLGMSIDAAYYAIDKEVHTNAQPPARLVYRPDEYMQADLCRADFDNYRGAYKVLIRRRHEMHGLMYLQGALRIRYVLEMDAWWAIRCKLNVPVIDPRKHAWKYEKPSAHYQYRGWMSARERDHLTFMMEYVYDYNMGDERHDFFQVITEPKILGLDGTSQLRGKYLTMSQTTPREPVCDDLVMRRVSRDDDDEIITCMRDLKILSTPEDIERAASLFLNTSETND